MMEKRGVVDPDWTKPVDDPEEQKTAAAETREEQVERLDDDLTKRASDAVADTLGRGK